jgi:hypothetical protein
VDVGLWQAYYGHVNDASHGLLPFRVWQFYQQMVEFVQQGEVAKFVCAAGTLAHYVGDACQPLHISYEFNGDPDHQGANGQELGLGVHSAYEDDMVNDHTLDILNGLGLNGSNGNQPNLGALPQVQGGQAAGFAVVDLMRQTFQTIAPKALVDAFAQLQDAGDTKRQIADALWEQFGAATIDVMAYGSRVLAMIWTSAWTEGGGDATIADLSAVDQGTLVNLYQDRNFVPSFTLDTIAQALNAPVGASR